MNVNDADVFKKIAEILKGTGRFQSVRWGRLEEPISNPTGGHAIIQRLSWRHDLRRANTDTLERAVRFRIDLRYYHPDVAARGERMISLEATIFNNLNNSSISGLVIPGRSTVETGADNIKEDLQPGLSQVMIDGNFSYAVDPTGGLSTP